MTILYATTNPGKFSEAKKNFATYGYSIVSPGELGLNLDVEETGTTLEANASLKAEAYLPHVPPDTIVLGDDTGMYITALGGEPGIKVRRWLGYKMTDEEIITYCLKRLEGVPLGERTLTISLALAVAKRGSPTQVFVGSYQTNILLKPRSLREPGFPFRPLITDEAPTHRLDAIRASLPYLATLLKQNH